MGAYHGDMAPRTKSDERVNVDLEPEEALKLLLGAESKKSDDDSDDAADEDPTGE
jgi:hypothetical protein